MKQKRDGVYIWVTWLTKLMTGEMTCEWASWLKANYEYYERIPSDFDAASWQIEHTKLLRELRIERQKAGGVLFAERQNSFKFKTPDGVMIAGTPDLIERTDGRRGIIYDAKTGQRAQSHQVQVMLYMYLLPRAKPEWANFTFEGIVYYKDGPLVIPKSAIEGSFGENLSYFINVLASPEPPLKVPEPMNCRFCDIHKQECPERIETV
jgi:hypothetical protein